jgi:hypothetical protein
MSKMKTYDFLQLELTKGERIWFMDESGVGFWGYYWANLDLDKMTFLFRNTSNGQDEKVEIEKLQRLERQNGNSR